jgi:transposase
MTRTYAAVDSHKDTHTIVVLNCFHEKLGEMKIGSAPSEFPKFLKRIKKYLQPNTTWAFGFEDTSAFGRSFVKFLVERGYLVKHVEASKVATERGQVLHKTDPYDAECACRVLINQFDNLPNANPLDKYWVITNLVTRRNALVKINVMVKNSLHRVVADHYPHYKTFFSCVTRDSALAFYEAYPSPHHLDNVLPHELAEFLHTASKGRLSSLKAEIILKHVQRDNVPKLEYQDSQDFTVRSLVRQVKTNLAELKAADIEIEKLLQEFNYPLTSIIGVDNLTAAKIIAEIGDIRRFRNAKQLAKYSGVSPVTYASGMTNLQRANARGNRKLNEIFFKIALTSITPSGKNNLLLNPICYDYFQKKLSEGKTKNQAIKSVQRRLVNIVFNVMKHNRPYDRPDSAYLNADPATA